MRRVEWAGLALCLSAMPMAASAERATGESVIEEINYARANPRAYADELRAYRTYYDGNLVSLPDGETLMRTREGVAAVDEAIRFMEQQQPLPPLKFSTLLTSAAGDHVRDQGESGRTGHISESGLNPGQRVRKRGGDIYITESLTYGPETAADVVTQLIIDDNVKNRGHRKMLFSTRWKYVGALCGPHTHFRRMCVIDLAEQTDGSATMPKALAD